MGRPETDARLDDVDVFPARTPAEVDREHFREGASVRFWNEWRFEGTPGAVKALVDSVTSTLASPSDARYWAYHVFRSSWFLGQGAASLLAQTIATRGAGANPIGADGGLGTKAAAGARLFAEALTAYKQDLAHINEGKYRPPYDMDPRHRQFNPLYVADKTARFLSEAAATLAKNRAARSTGAASGAADDLTKVWMGGGNIYPDYYLKTFHWQTDGWMSSKSAEVYEVSTETLFLGRQDAMQRTVLVPLKEWFVEKTKMTKMTTPNDAAVNDAIKADGEGATLLDLACGTGRFLTFVRDNYPKMDVTGLDLSPFYLAEARKNSEYFERLRHRQRRDTTQASGGGGIHQIAEAFSRVEGMAKAAGLPLPPFPGTSWDGTADDDADAGSRVEELGKCELVHAKAESMPFPEASFDVVTCVYLLHEIPAEARRAVAAEVARVLKPGGVLVLADSIQLGDRPHLDKHLGRFGDFNEPHYRDYIASELVSVFGPEGAGLEPWTKELCSSTKALSFRKPAA